MSDGLLSIELWRSAYGRDLVYWRRVLPRRSNAPTMGKRATVVQLLKRLHQKYTVLQIKRSGRFVQITFNCPHSVKLTARGVDR